MPYSSSRICHISPQRVSLLLQGNRIGYAVTYVDVFFFPSNKPLSTQTPIPKAIIMRLKNTQFIIFSTCINISLYFIRTLFTLWKPISHNSLLYYSVGRYLFCNHTACHFQTAHKALQNDKAIDNIQCVC